MFMRMRCSVYVTKTFAVRIVYAEIMELFFIIFKVTEKRTLVNMHFIVHLRRRNERVKRCVIFDFARFYSSLTHKRLV